MNRGIILSIELRDLVVVRSTLVKQTDVLSLVSMSIENGKMSQCLDIFLNVKCSKKHGNLNALPSVYNEQDQNKMSFTSHILSAVLQNHKILNVNYNCS